MKNKGFTLIELLGVIIILALLMIIVFPSIVNSVKNSSSKTDDLTKELIYNAADLFIDNHINDFPKLYGSEFSIELKDLVDEGLLTGPIKLSDVDITNTKCIQVTYQDDYKYELKDIDTCTEIIRYVLPEEYQQVEYIESTGTQYIDTGVIPNQNTAFDIVFLTKNIVSSSSDEFGSIFGARQTSAVNELQLTTYSGISDHLGTLRYGNTSNNAGITSNIKMHITYMYGQYSNNSSLTYNVTSTFQSPVTLTLFAIHDVNSVYQFGKVQLYSFKLYDGNQIIRDFVPCYHIADNIIGLYDLVEGNFYTNSGTGTFEKGSNV